MPHWPLLPFWPEKCLVKHHFPPFLQFRLFSSETQSNRDRVIDPTFTGYLTVQKEKCGVGGRRKIKNLRMSQVTKLGRR